MLQRKCVFIFCNHFYAHRKLSRNTELHSGLHYYVFGSLQNVVRRQPLLFKWSSYIWFVIEQYKRKAHLSEKKVLYHNTVHLPANNNELALGGLWSDASPDVHGEQSAAAVKDGGQRGHESRQHDSQHQSSQPCAEGKEKRTERRSEEGAERNYKTSFLNVYVIVMCPYHWA